MDRKGCRQLPEVMRKTEDNGFKEVVWLVCGYSKEAHPSVFYPTVNHLFDPSSPLSGRGG